MLAGGFMDNICGFQGSSYGSVVEKITNWQKNYFSSTHTTGKLLRESVYMEITSLSHTIEHFGNWFTGKKTTHYITISYKLTDIPKVE